MMYSLCKRHSNKWEDLPTFQRQYIMAKDTIKSLVTDIAGNDERRAALIERLRPLVEAQRWDRERAERELKPIYAAARGLTLIVSERGTKAGQATFDRSTKAGDNARKAFKTLLDALFTGSAASAGEGKTDLLVPPEIAKLAAKLVALCNEYEEAKRLANIAVAKAFAK